MKSLKLALKINLAVLILVACYFIMGFVIIQGSLYEIQGTLSFLFYLNCFVVGIKLYVDEKKGFYSIEK